jgi:IS1 family transposase
VELDEMWHYLKQKRRKLWIWKALDWDTGQLLDRECGRRDKTTLKKMVDRLAHWDVQLFCTELKALEFPFPTIVFWGSSVCVSLTQSRPF